MSGGPNLSVDEILANNHVDVNNYRADGSRKNLRAIHNLSESKLLASAELGGMVMPGLVVTKDNIFDNHSRSNISDI